MKRKVADIMERKVLTVAPGKSLPELERALLRSRVSAMPVVERGGKMVGIVSRSDVVRQLCLERSLGEAMAEVYHDQTDDKFVEKAQRAVAQAIGQRMEQLCVRDVMIRDVITVAPDMPVVEAAKLMMERRVHRLPVVENGKLVGIVTSFDFARIVAEHSAP
jgi:CBS domain-containing protein